MSMKRQLASVMEGTQLRDDEEIEPLPTEASQKAASEPTGAAASEPTGAAASEPSDAAASIEVSSNDDSSSESEGTIIKFICNVELEIKTVTEYITVLRALESKLIMQKTSYNAPLIEDMEELNTDATILVSRLEDMKENGQDAQGLENVDAGYSQLCKSYRSIGKRFWNLKGAAERLMGKPTKRFIRRHASDDLDD